VKRIVLVGGGHAHVHLLKVAASRLPPGTELVLISPGPRHHYSGMVPGFLEGTYEEPELAFDLAALAGAAGARFQRGTATSLSVEQRQVTVDGATALDFDAVSLDIGSAPVGMDLPGVAAHAATVRPMSRAVALRDRLDLLLERPSREPVHVAVVGAGAAGVEVALAVHRRILRAGRTVRVTLVDAGEHLLPDFSPRVRARAAGILEKAGVGLRLRARATEVTPEHLVLDAGEALASHLTVWLAGAAPPALLADSDLPRSPEGFFLVDAELRGVAGSTGARPPAWGAGDCIALEGAPWMPRAGVYAVRQSPVLAHNVLTEEPPRSYAPQRSFLSLLNTADGRALLRWKGVVSHSCWAWWLKNAIDRRFMARYQP